MTSWSTEMHFINTVCVCSGELLAQFSLNIFIIEERSLSFPEGELRSHILLWLELIEYPLRETMHVKRSGFLSYFFILSVLLCWFTMCQMMTEALMLYWSSTAFKENQTMPKSSVVDWGHQHSHEVFWVENNRREHWNGSRLLQ